jgi:hypothetical protein
LTSASSQPQQSPSRVPVNQLDFEEASSRRPFMARCDGSIGMPWKQYCEACQCDGLVMACVVAESQFRESVAAGGLTGKESKGAIVSLRLNCLSAKESLDRDDHLM